jgi:hypothetical protein
LWGVLSQSIGKPSIVVAPSVNQFDVMTLGLGGLFNLTQSALASF